MTPEIKAAIKLLRKAGWTLEPPEATLTPAAEVKVKVGLTPPDPLTPEIIHASFRLAGFSGDAINHPLSERAYIWRCRFNGAEPGKTPWTWRYASNPTMQALLDRYAVEAGITD
ncbi:hypothetical protein KIKIMORA_01360 [Brevundimonas phage vB_BpoS-Kikimora]|uniref:Uncharacterized protein n=1 Tax=Brevundimonas phage vB_BpoS-Kikimora TaxID=2948601 RepID=A0A9E7SMS0_9CAUD|nr:hypothetical protein KIKIMORA_01360 [Brevundimonas phage vB_BpoS-Kikimora]